MSERVSGRIKFFHGDSFEVLTKFRRNAKAVFFVDPPYTAGGKSAGSRLYIHSVIDHEKLFSLCENLQDEFLMTYDNAEEVHVLAERHGFETKAVSMKNTHHAEMNELLIGRDLSWVEAGGIFREDLSPTSEPLPKMAPVRYSISKRRKSASR